MYISCVSYALCSDDTDKIYICDTDCDGHEDNLSECSRVCWCDGGIDCDVCYHLVVGITCGKWCNLLAKIFCDM